MQICLTKPELAQFVEDQVKAGRYPTAEAVVEAAVQELCDSARTDLDEQTIGAIHRAEAQFDRGEGIDFATFAKQMRKKMATR